MVPYGLAVRIPGFHPGDPGSTPGVGSSVLVCVCVCVYTAGGCVGPLVGVKCRARIQSMDHHTWSHVTFTSFCLRTESKTEQLGTLNF